MPTGKYQEQVDSFNRLGYCVLKRVMPASLLKELRVNAEVARAIARRLRGPDAQRLQPLAGNLTDAQMKPFNELYTLESILDPFAAILPPTHEVSTKEMGILFEPAEKAYTTHWHRDARNVKNAEQLAAWERTQNNPDVWNQINLPLYEDTCTWVVPGSHNRPDLPCESGWLKNQDVPDKRPAPVTVEEQEYRALDNVLAMPGGMRVVLDAGDMLLYRNTIWHLGNYTPFKRRATLHDNPVSLEARRLGGEALGIKATPGAK